MAVNTHSSLRGVFTNKMRAYPSVLISSNRHAQVYRVRRRRVPQESWRSYCLKVLHIDEANLVQHESVLRRIPQLSADYHPHDLPVPPLASFGRMTSSHNESRGTLWIATPWVEGSSLSQLMADATCREDPPRFSEALQIARSIAKNIVDLGCLEGCDTRLVHGDLKPSNVIVTSCSPVHTVLVDFDTASFAGDKVVPLCGTFGYAAPESFCARHSRSCTNGARDVYSLGVILHELLTGRGPHPYSSVLVRYLTQLSTTAKGVSGVQVDESLPVDVRNVLTSCLALHPAARPHPDELLKAISRLAERYEDNEHRCSFAQRTNEVTTLLQVRERPTWQNAELRAAQ